MQKIARKRDFEWFLTLCLTNENALLLEQLSRTGVKPIFHLATLFARTDKKVGTVSTRLRQIFSPANFNQSRCRILVFASRRANKVSKWKIGFTVLDPSVPYCILNLQDLNMLCISDH